MGEMAEAMLSGEMCQGCGEYLGGGDGFPMFCGGCKRRGYDETERPTRSAKSVQLEFHCGGRRAYARFKYIVEASTHKLGVNWDDAPTLHAKLLGRGFIIRGQDGKAWVSTKGMVEYRRAQ